MHRGALTFVNWPRFLGVANDIEVRLPIISRRPDPEIARDAVAAVRNELHEVADAIKVTVEDGWVTLDGEVGWHYLHERAEDAVRSVKGVKAVRNFIRLKPSVTPAATIKQNIAEAFRRNAALDAKRIAIEITDGAIVLKGTVRSWVERQEAERIAWSAPGVSKVDNRLLVDPAMAQAA
jgi:osmotically-inducible protein OsmY